MTDKPQDWTSEPWTYDGSRIEKDTDGRIFHWHYIGGVNEAPIFSVRCARKEGVPNTKRIVATVNALAGVPDPAEFMEAHWELMRHIAWAVLMLESEGYGEYVEFSSIEEALARVRKAGGA